MSSQTRMFHAFIWNWIKGKIEIYPYILCFLLAIIDIIISYHIIIDIIPNLRIGTSWFDHNPATHSLDHGVYVRPRFVHSIADRRIVPRCWHLTTIFSFQRTKWRRWQRNHAKWKSVSWGNFYDSGKCIKKETMNIIYIFNSILYDTTFDLAKPRGMDDI